VGHGIKTDFLYVKAEASFQEALFSAATIDGPYGGLDRSAHVFGFLSRWRNLNVRFSHGYTVTPDRAGRQRDRAAGSTGCLTELPWLDSLALQTAGVNGTLELTYWPKSGRLWFAIHGQPPS
jgi:hypothetical protein